MQLAAFVPDTAFVGLAGVAFFIWAIIDVVFRPDWAFEVAGSSRTLWVVFVLVGLLICGGLVFSLIHRLSIRPTALPAQTTTTTLPVPVGVSILPGQNLQAAVSANPGGTTFLIQAGVHHNDMVRPADGDSFIGAPGAVLDGGSVTQAAFYGHAANVTIRNLTIRNYDPPFSRGAINGQEGDDWTDLSSGWVVDNNMITGNAAMGIRTGNGMHVTNNHINSNGQLGMGGTGTNILVASNEIAFNNTGNFDPLVEAGGAKFAVTEGLVVRSNNVHDNKAEGIWCDQSCHNTLIEGNTITNNSDDGIVYEISFQATIRNNTVTGNGSADSTNCFWDAGNIVIADSPNVEAYGNTVSGANGIGILQQNRTDDPSPYGAHATHDTYIHDNTITATGCAAGMVNDTGNLTYFTGDNNFWVHNTYHLPDQTSQWFAWMNSLQTASQWQTYGQDQSGTFTTP